MVRQPASNMVTKIALHHIFGIRVGGSGLATIATTTRCVRCGECEAVLREALIQASAQTMSSISLHQTVQRQSGKDNFDKSVKPRD